MSNAGALTEEEVEELLCIVWQLASPALVRLVISTLLLALAPYDSVLANPCLPKFQVVAALRRLKGGKLGAAAQQALLTHCLCHPVTLQYPPPDAWCRWV